MSTPRSGPFLEVSRGLGEPAVIPLQRGQELPPMSVGRRGMWRVDGAKGVLDVHAYLFFDGEELFLQSADESSPALADGKPVGTEWTPVEESCEIRLGAVSLRYHAPERETGPSLSNEERTAFFTPSAPPQRRGPQPPAVDQGPPANPANRVGGPSGAGSAQARSQAPQRAPHFRPPDSESTRIRPFDGPANPNGADCDDGVPSSERDQTLVHQGAREPMPVPGSAASQRPAAGRPAAGRPPESRIPSQAPAAAFGSHTQGAPPPLLSVSHYIDEATALADSQGALMNATIAGPLEMMMPHLQKLQRQDVAQGPAAGPMQNAPYGGPQNFGPQMPQPFAGGYPGAQSVGPGGAYPQPYAGPLQGQGAPFSGPTHGFSAGRQMPPGNAVGGLPAQPHSGGLPAPTNVSMPNALPRKGSWAWFRGEWSRTSFPKKVIFFLSPALLWGVPQVFDDAPSTLPIPPASVSVSASSAPTTPPTAPLAVTPPVVAPTPPEPPSTAAPVLSTVPTSVATAQASASVAATAKTAATAKHAPPPSNSTDEKNTDARSLERQAVDAVANSQFEDAARLYDELARKEPTNKVFPTAARVMHGKARPH